MPDTQLDSRALAASPWRWFRAVVVAFAFLFIIVAVWSIVLTFLHPWGVDYLSFWAAGRLVLQGDPSLAYNIGAHGAVENTIAHIGGRMPFPYPPPFLAIVTPFAFLPFGAAFIAWVAVTSIFYAYSMSRMVPLAIAFGNTPACIDFMIGQNGFLICGVFTLGLSLISLYPFFAGGILGFMILKPQLALLLPVAMLAGREWRVIAGAVVTSIALVLVAVIALGLRSYEGFWNILPFYVDLLRHNKEPWNELISPFALARFVGIPLGAALLIHILVAIPATVATARAWWLKMDQRVPILAAATLLVPPYAFTYDALLIVVPLGYLFTHKQHPIVVAIAWLCSFIPLITYFSPWLGPNFTSIACVACLVALHFPKQMRSPGDQEARADGAMMCAT